MSNNSKRPVDVMKHSPSNPLKMSNGPLLSTLDRLAVDDCYQRSIEVNKKQNHPGRSKLYQLRGDSTSIANQRGLTNISVFEPEVLALISLILKYEWRENLGLLSIFKSTDTQLRSGDTIFD